MAFIIQSETKYTPTLRMVIPVYPEQLQARCDERMDRAARDYWHILSATGDRSMAEAVARGQIAPGEFTSPRFQHFIEKRGP